MLDWVPRLIPQYWSLSLILVRGIVQCIHVGSASACTCVLLVHNTTDNASTIVVVHVQIVSIRHTILSVWQMLDVLMHNSANIHAQCLTMEDHL